MGVAIITGSAGLIGSEAAVFLADKGMDVVGIDNNMRQVFFGSEASTLLNRRRLERQLGGKYHHHDQDIRDQTFIQNLFKIYQKDIKLVVHTAAQPSHDWAAKQPITDFTINANGTLNILEATRHHAPDAVFIFTSTNKVYGDRPNRLPLHEEETRYEIDPSHLYADGITEQMSIDQSLHSIFGASKLAADILVQEYGHYFGIRTACFRGGCLTGSHHAGTQLHGFLSYLMKCTVTGAPYTVFGYQGKQVRDNIHSSDLIEAFWAFFNKPQVAQVYNIGGGRFSNCSMLEAIEICQQIAGRALDWSYHSENRVGDHIWWISNLKKFTDHYPDWRVRYDIPAILNEIYQVNHKRWLSESGR